MTQPVTQEELSALLDDALPPRRAAEVEARLAQDPALRAEYEALARTVALYRGTPLPEPPPGPPLFLPARDADGARGSVSMPADTRSDEAAAAPSGRRGWWVGLATAAAVALALGGLLVSQGGVPGALSPADVAMSGSSAQGDAEHEGAAESDDDAMAGAPAAEQALPSADEIGAEAPPIMAQREAQPGRGGDAPAREGAEEAADAEEAEVALVDEDASVDSESGFAPDSRADSDADPEAEAGHEGGEGGEGGEARDVAQAPDDAEVVAVTVGPPEPDLDGSVDETVTADEVGATSSPAFGLLVALGLAALGIGALAWATARRRAG